MKPILDMNCGCRICEAFTRTGGEAQAAKAGHFAREDQGVGLQAGELMALID